MVRGEHLQNPVILFRDTGYADRYFFGVGQEDDLAVRFTIAGQDLKNISEALRQAAEDLKDEV